MAAESGRTRIPHFCNDNPLLRHFLARFRSLRWFHGYSGPEEARNVTRFTVGRPRGRTESGQNRAPGGIKLVILTESDKRAIPGDSGKKVKKERFRQKVAKDGSESWCSGLVLPGYSGSAGGFRVEFLTKVAKVVILY